MRRGKKFIVSAVLASVVLVGSIGGVVVAQNGDDGQPEARHEVLLGRVCEIYQEKTGVAIDQEVLKDSFAQAQRQMREAAMETRLQYLVEQGTISEDEAGQYMEWWQSRPDVAVGPGFGGHGGLRAPPPAE